MGCAPLAVFGQAAARQNEHCYFLGNFMIRRLLALSVACASLSAPALAADLIVASDEVAVASDGFDWARPYIGAELAGGVVDAPVGPTIIGGHHLEMLLHPLPFQPPTGDTRALPV